MTAVVMGGDAGGAGSAYSDREKVSCILKAAAAGDQFAFESAAADLDGCDKVAEVARAVKDGNKRGALHFAALRGHAKLVRFLIGELKCAVDEADAEGDTPLLLAARGGFADAAAALLDAGANPRARGAGGAEPVHHGAASGCAALLKRLLEAGAPVEAASDAGPPLLWAAGQAHAECVEALVQAGASANAVNGDGVTALVMVAALGGDHGAAACVRALAAGGADMNRRMAQMDAFTALHVAADMGDAEVVSTLLECGSDPNVSDASGFRPIDVAAAAGDKAIVKLLLSKTDPAPGVKPWTVESVIKAAQASGARAAAAPAPPPPQARKPTPPAVPAISPEATAAAAAAKALGDSAFALRKDYPEAVAAYTTALEQDPYNGTVLANRSLCRLMLGDREGALADAEGAVKYRPDWGKAHFRRGAALEAFERWEDAANAYFDGVQVDGANVALARAFRECIERGRAAHIAATQKK